MLEVALRHGFPGFRLDVTFRAAPGITVLFGPSGSGKTTVVNAVAGLLRPQEGRIALGDRVLVDTEPRRFVPPHRRRIGYVFQEDRLFPHLSVAQNLRYGTRFGGAAARVVDRDQVVEMLGLGGFLDRRPGALSGGERSRVALGRALMAGPSLILADEPLAALDEARKAEILPYFERLRDVLAVPILYVSHAAPEVARLATTVVVLEAGRVARTGAPDAVLPGPGTPRGPVVRLAMVQGPDQQDGLCEVTGGGLRLLLPQDPAVPPGPVEVAIAAGDVLLARDRPETLAALNVVPGEIVEIAAPLGGAVLVGLRTPAGRLAALVPQRSVAALDLCPGTAVHAVITTATLRPRRTL